MQLVAMIPFLLILVGVGLAFARVRPAMLAWAICAAGVLSGVGIAVTLLVFGQPHQWVYAAVAALPFVIAVPMVIKDLSYPRINDVTTNIENPPEFLAALQAKPNLGRDMTYPEHFAPIVKRSYSDVRPLLLDETPEQVFRLMETLAKLQTGWVIRHSDAENFTLEGEVTTSLLRFVDDVAIKLSDHKGKTRVDMRSKSREGLVDAGKNAKRIRSFLERLANKQANG